MSILIRGMEMPTEGEISKCIIVKHDGEVWIVDFDSLVDGGFVACFPTNPMRAVPVPPHGDLIDADKLVELCDIMADKCDGIGASIWHQFKTTAEWSPIVIPAEEGK